MRRPSSGDLRPYRAYDPHREVDAARLQTIGAISLAWNWLEGSIDTGLSIALNQHPSLWLEITTRINGFDGKIAILKKCAHLFFDGIAQEPAEPICKTLNAIGDTKKLRDGVIHVRLTDPTNVIADIPVYKGKMHEVLVSQPALDGVYERVLNLARESDELVALFFRNWQIMHGSNENDRPRHAQHFREALTQLRTLQQKREAFQPLPEFPDPPPTIPSSEAAK